MADGDSLLLGNDNNAQSQTSLNRTGFGDDTPRPLRVARPGP